MKKIYKNLLLNLLGVVAVVGATTALVVSGIISATAFVLAAIACFPMAKNGSADRAGWRCPLDL